MSCVAPPHFMQEVPLFVPDDDPNPMTLLKKATDFGMGGCGRVPFMRAYPQCGCATKIGA